TNRHVVADHREHTGQAGIAFDGNPLLVIFFGANGCVGDRFARFRGGRTRRDQRNGTQRTAKQRNSVFHCVVHLLEQALSSSKIASFSLAASRVCLPAARSVRRVRRWSSASLPR